MIGWLRRLLGSPANPGDDAARQRQGPVAGAAASAGLPARPSGGAAGAGEEPRTTRDARWEDVEAVAALLEAHRVDYVLIGGYALAANGLVRQTGDVDLIVRNTPENNRRWIEALSGLPDGAAAELRGEDDPFAPGSDAGDAEPGPIRIFDEFVVDVMPRACGLAYEDVEAHIGRIENGGRIINVLNLHGLLLTKRGVREKDVADRSQIEIALSKLAAHPGGPSAAGLSP